METVNLPLWVEYVKALGTPVVAIVAASIAGAIAYRQLRTARNKLKLDLFDKRMAVYQNAVQLITECAWVEPVDWARVVELTQNFPSARWLFNAAIADYLQTLEAVGGQTKLKPKIDFEDLTREQQLELMNRVNKESTENRVREMTKLDAMFEPYLALEH